VYFVLSCRTSQSEPESTWPSDPRSETQDTHIFDRERFALDGTRKLECRQACEAGVLKAKASA
jgi:hypothetical protein